MQCVKGLHKQSQTSKQIISNMESAHRSYIWLPPLRIFSFPHIIKKFQVFFCTLGIFLFRRIVDVDLLLWHRRFFQNKSTISNMQKMVSRVVKYDENHTVKVWKIERFFEVKKELNFKVISEKLMKIQILIYSTLSPPIPPCRKKRVLTKFLEILPPNCWHFDRRRTYLCVQWSAWFRVRTAKIKG